MHKCVFVNVLLQKLASFDDLCLRAPATLRSSCKCESASTEFGDVASLRLNCKNINSTRDFSLEDDSIQDQNPNAIVVDDSAAQQVN